MKLGFTLRRLVTFLSHIFRMTLNLLYYFGWLIFDLSKFKKIKNEKIKNLLVIYGGAMGDTYNLLGILNQLTEDYPNLKINFLTYNQNQSFIKNPKINVIGLAETERLIHKKFFDALVILGHPLNNIFPKKFHLGILKIPYRAGAEFISPTYLFKKFPILLTRKVFPRYRSGVEDWRAAFRLLGFQIKNNPKFYFTKKGEKEAEEFLLTNKLSKDKKLIFLHPGAGTISLAKKEGKVPSHEWPKERWSKLADKLIKKYHCKIIFTGSQNEKELINLIISKTKNKSEIISVADKLSVEGLASLMRVGNLLISIDTGVVHIGAHSGIPVIDLFGPFPSKLAAPWTDKKTMILHKGVCNSCRRYACPEKNPVCMKAITVDEILNDSEKWIK